MSIMVQYLEAIFNVYLIFNDQDTNADNVENKIRNNEEIQKFLRQPRDHKTFEDEDICYMAISHWIDTEIYKKNDRISGFFVRFYGEDVGSHNFEKNFYEIVKSIIREKQSKYQNERVQHIIDLLHGEQCIAQARCINERHPKVKNYYNIIEVYLMTIFISSFQNLNTNIIKNIYKLLLMEKTSTDIPFNESFKFFPSAYQTAQILFKSGDKLNRGAPHLIPDNIVNELLKLDNTEYNSSYSMYYKLYKTIGFCQTYKYKEIILNLMVNDTFKKKKKKKIKDFFVEHFTTIIPIIVVFLLYIFFSRLINLP